MIVLWLIVWALNGYPQLHAWNSWLVALLVMGAVDVGGGIERVLKRAVGRRDV